MTPASSTSSPARPRFRDRLFLQVVIAIVLGVVLGGFWPVGGEALRPLGDGFIRLIRMLLAPIIGGTIVVGIARMDNLREVGRIGLKALVYFEVVSTAALGIGLVVVNVLQPGAGLHVNPADLDASALAGYTAAAQTQGGIAGFLLGLVPTSVVDAFARNDMLPIILFSVLLGVAMARLRTSTEPLLRVIDALLQALFAIVGMIMRLAPLAALGAMAFTVGKYGFGVLASLGQLMIAVSLTSVIFVGVVLGLIARAAGVSLWKFLRYIREEIVIVFATVSTEVVLPRMVTKLEAAGCSRPVVGLVLPAGYTFNPDGTAIYLTMAAIFIAQATHTPLTLGDQLVVLGVLMLTSKGSAGVAGGGFVTLAATLASLHKIPVAGLVLLLGVDRFINEARAVTNLIGNGVATLVIARWDGALDRRRLDAALNGPGGGTSGAP